MKLDELIAALTELRGNSAGDFVVNTSPSSTPGEEVVGYTLNADNKTVELNTDDL